MTTDLIGDILAIISDALQILAAIVALTTVGPVACDRLRAADNRPRMNSTRRTNSKRIRRVRRSRVSDNFPPEDLNDTSSE